jgi:hypothetical protein
VGCKHVRLHTARFQRDMGCAGAGSFAGLSGSFHVIEGVELLCSSGMRRLLLVFSNKTNGVE